MTKKHDVAFGRRHGKLRRSIDETQTSDHRQCLWHGKTDRGFPLRCHNNCLNHPHDKIINHLGKPYPRPLDFCSYHVRYCVETVKHGDMPIKIRVQNELALWWVHHLSKAVTVYVRIYPHFFFAFSQQWVLCTKDKCWTTYIKSNSWN